MSALIIWTISKMFQIVPNYLKTGLKLLGTGQLRISGLKLNPGIKKRLKRKLYLESMWNYNLTMTRLRTLKKLKSITWWNVKLLKIMSDEESQQVQSENVNFVICTNMSDKKCYYVINNTKRVRSASKSFKFQTKPRNKHKSMKLNLCKYLSIC